MRDLVLMVREDQIVPAPVNVKLLPQVLQAHGGALDVPPRPARPPRTLPTRLSRLRRLPQSKISRVPLPRVDLQPRPCLHVFQLPPGQLAIVRVAGHFEVHISVNPIGMTFLDQPLHHPDNRLNLSGYPGLYGGRKNIKVLEVPVVLLDITLRQLMRIDPQFTGPHDDLVVNVGVVHHVADLVTAVFKVAADDVENDG